MRITAGKLRGRKLPVPEFPEVRPTPAKVRQALFNIIGPLDGMAVLDLFSGSGLMALESLSRGAASVVSIEKNPRIIKHMFAMRGQLALETSWSLVCGDVQKKLPHLKNHHFDIIFADPPYATNISQLLPAWLDSAGVSCTQLIIEEAAHVNPIWPAGWTACQSRRYGKTCLHFLEAESP